MKRKILTTGGKLLLALCLLVYFENMMAQTPRWQWARQAGGTSGETIRSICRDANGNVFATGSFLSSTINFGNTSLANAGSNDIYIVKYDPQGNISWARRFGAAGSEIAFDITADPSGNIIITGSFSSTSFSFDNIVLTNSGGTCSGGWGLPIACIDVFVAKLDNNGNTVWAQNFGIPSRSENATNIIADQSGNIYFTGEFTGTISFGSSVLSTNSGLKGIFLTKFDGSGNTIWAKALPGGNSYCRDISIDGSGNVVLTGTYNLSITFDNITLTDALGHIFVVKYNSAGNLLWAKGEGGRSNSGNVAAIATNGNEIYITGSFTSGSIKFGKINLRNCKSCRNMFLVRYDASGNAQWASAATNTSDAGGTAVGVDPNGNVIVAGGYSSASVAFGNTLLSNNGLTNVFLAKYNSEGNPLWATTIGGSSSEGTSSVTTDESGSIYIGGAFNSPSVSFGNDVLTNVGQADLFLAKINDDDGITAKTPASLPKETSEITVHKIYPNPAVDRINFQLPANIQPDGMLLAIYNVQGARLKEISLKSAATIILLDAFKPGVYFYRATKKGEMIYSGKFIVQ